jgi:hypothetical protein
MANSWITQRQVILMLTDISNGMSSKDAARKYNVSIRTVQRKKSLKKRYKNKKLAPCGTDAAYHRHRRKDETPCLIDYDAHTNYQAPKNRELRKAKREAGPSDLAG